MRQKHRPLPTPPELPKSRRLVNPRRSSGGGHNSGRAREKINRRPPFARGAGLLSRPAVLCEFARIARPPGANGRVIDRGLACQIMQFYFIRFGARVIAVSAAPPGPPMMHWPDRARARTGCSPARYQLRRPWHAARLLPGPSWIDRCAAHRRLKLSILNAGRRSRRGNFGGWWIWVWWRCFLGCGFIVEFGNKIG